MPRLALSVKLCGNINPSAPKLILNCTESGVGEKFRFSNTGASDGRAVTRGLQRCRGSWRLNWINVRISVAKVLFPRVNDNSLQNAGARIAGNEGIARGIGSVRNCDKRGRWEGGGGEGRRCHLHSLDSCIKNTVEMASLNTTRGSFSFDARVMR